MEDVLSIHKISAEKFECERCLNNITKYFAFGRYQVTLLYIKDGKKLLGDSYAKVLPRVPTLEDRFRLDHRFKNLYVKLMDESEAKGYMQLIPAKYILSSVQWLGSVQKVEHQFFFSENLP